MRHLIAWKSMANIAPPPLPTLSPANRMMFEPRFSYVDSLTDCRLITWEIHLNYKLPACWGQLLQGRSTETNKV
jgi:hypothetical protein